VRATPLFRDAHRLASNELRYYVDELGQRLTALDELFGVTPSLRVAAREDELEEDAYPAYDELTGDELSRKPTRRFRARGGVARPTRPPASRDMLLAGVAEAMLLERALPELLDADAHAITIVMSRVGTTVDAGGLMIATEALGQPGWIDEAAFMDASGTIAPLGLPGTQTARKKIDARMPPGLTALAHEVALNSEMQRARDVVITLRGLFVRAALENEHGTWMIRAAAAEPDVVRVEIRPGASDPQAILRTHAAARRELDRVLEHGGALPPNPDVLLPVTRTLTYRPPLRPGETYGVEIEDFGTGWVDRGTARDLKTAIRRAWHLAWSRT
jgi:hypothetical protein